LEEDCRVKRCASRGYFAHCRAVALREGETPDISDL